MIAINDAVRTPNASTTTVMRLNRELGGVRVIPSRCRQGHSRGSVGSVPLCRRTPSSADPPARATLDRSTSRRGGWAPCSARLGGSAREWPVAPAPLDDRSNLSLKAVTTLANRSTPTPSVGDADAALAGFARGRAPAEALRIAATTADGPCDDDRGIPGMGPA